MLTRRQTLFLFTSMSAAAALAPQAFAKTPEIYAEDGIAIDGSDAVAYFTQGEPVAGSEEFSLMWKGATWLFSSAENRAAFEEDPEAYAPQYGGYCALAMASGYLAPTHPDAWTIYEGKLYLNYSTHARSQWKRDIPGNIARADGHWPGVLD